MQMQMGSHMTLNELPPSPNKQTARNLTFNFMSRFLNWIDSKRDSPNEKQTKKEWNLQSTSDVKTWKIDPFLFTAHNQLETTLTEQPSYDRVLCGNRHCYLMSSPAASEEAELGTRSGRKWVKASPLTQNLKSHAAVLAQPRWHRWTSDWPSQSQSEVEK